VLKVKVKVKGHVIRALSWILGMSYSVIDGLVRYVVCELRLIIELVALTNKIKSLMASVTASGQDCSRLLSVYRIRLFFFHVYSCYSSLQCIWAGLPELNMIDKSYIIVTANSSRSSIF